MRQRTANALFQAFRDGDKVKTSGDCEQCKREPDNAPSGRLCNNCGEAELVAHADAFFHCPSCGRGYTADQLEAISQRSRRTQDNQDIRDCWQEDTRRGSRGGGSGDKGPKKEDKLSGRSLQQLKKVEWSEEESKIVKQNSLEPKGKIRTIKGLPEGTTGEQIRAAAARKLGID